MIGYETSSSPSMVYIVTKTSPVKNFKHVRQNDMHANMATILLPREPLEVKFLGNLKPSDKKLDMQRTPTQDIIFNCFLSSCLSYLK